MKAFKIKLTIGVFLLAVVMFSCQKDIDYFVPNPNQPIADTSWTFVVEDTMPIGVLQKSIAKPYTIDSVNIDSISTTSYTSVNGLKLTIRPNILTASLGTTPVNGLVAIENIVLKKNGEFISADIFTNTNTNRLLESGAACFLKIKKGINVLQLTQNATVNIALSAAPSSSFIQLFYGTNRLPISWEASIAGTPNIVTTTNNGYDINTNKLGWMNVVKNIATGTTNLIAGLDSQFTNKNTAVYVSVNSKVCVVKLFPDPINKTFNSTPLVNNQQVTVTSLSKIGNQYFLGTKLVVVQNNGSINQTVNLTPQVSTLEQIQAHLNNL
jgi:hypothetical protein